MPEPTVFARIPSIDALIIKAGESGLVEAFGRDRVVRVLREEVAGLRADIAARGMDALPESPAPMLLARVGARLEVFHKPGLRRVLNLTGTVLHSNLGRASLPPEAIAAMDAAAGGVNVEMDLEHGRRGDRGDHVNWRLVDLTGAEAVTVVNNNAAAVLLALNTLALGREVLVSRGELIEIGGAFRLPEIMQCAGCTLVEVGTTNRTHQRDYQEAIGPSSAALLKVHPSNYQVCGFTHSVQPEAVAMIAHAHGLPLIHDLGSGSLIDLSTIGLPSEPTVGDSLNAGADIVTFSGDKLLGGPQCGIIAGRAELIDRIQRNPMRRAMRLDKIMLAALESVLRLYVDRQRAIEQIPTLRHLARPSKQIGATANALITQLPVAVTARAYCRVVDCDSCIGSGALPLATLPSQGLALQPKTGGGAALHKLAADLRTLPTPVIGRIENNAVLLDLRCLDSETDLLRSLAQLPDLNR